MKGKIGARLVGSLKPSAKLYEVWDTEHHGFVLRVRPSGAMAYFFSYRRGDGRRTWYKLGSHPALTTSQARDLSIEAAAKVRMGFDPMLEKKRAKLECIRSFLEDHYRPWALANHKDGNATVDRIINQFSFIIDKRLDEVTSWQLEKWIAERKRTGTKPATINREVASLKAMFSKAVQWELIKQNPISSVKMLKLDKVGIVRYLSADEETRLRQAMDQREMQIREARLRANGWRSSRGYSELPPLNEPYVDHLKPMILVSINTGIRRGELFSLQWEDIDLFRRMITIRGDISKSRQTRHIPLNDEALQVLNNCAKSPSRLLHGLVFPGARNERLVDIKKSWRGVIQLSVIAKFRWHDLRHHFASRLVMAGVDLNTVRELLGHKDIKTTLRYAHLSPTIKLEAVQKLGTFKGVRRSFDVAL